MTAAKKGQSRTALRWSPAAPPDPGRPTRAPNRTYLNDLLVIEAWLADGDHITVGQTVLKFVAPGNLEAQYHSKVHQRAILDPLTRLYNRRYFLDVLEREMPCARRYRRPFSLAILDVDRFKPINDELGHLGGDEILQALSGLLRQEVRKDDVVARLGGEEFALLLPETGLRDALDLAEAVRLAVERHRFVQICALQRVAGQTTRTTYISGMLTKATQEAVNWLFWLHDGARRERSSYLSEIGFGSRRESLARALLFGGIWCLYIAGAALGSYTDSLWRLWSLAGSLAILTIAIVADLWRPFRP